MPNATQSIDPSRFCRRRSPFGRPRCSSRRLEFGVFTQLGGRRVSGAELGGELGLHPRGTSDFFDAVVAMRFLDRNKSSLCRQNPDRAERAVARRRDEFVIAEIIRGLFCSFGHPAGGEAKVRIEHRV